MRLVFGSCRVGDPQPDSTRACHGPRSSKRTGIDALWTYAKQLQRGEIEWPDARAAARRPGVRRRGVAGDRASSSAHGATRASRRASEIADFEEYTRLYRESWSEPDIRWLLSTVPTRDDLRRPRRQRRLEHLLELGRGDARQALVGRADHRRVHVVLDLPAHRQPLPARARRRGDARRVSRPTRTQARACGEIAQAVGPRVGGKPLGVLPRFRRLRGCSCSTRAPRACSPTGAGEMIDEEEWDWIVEHSRRRVRPSRDREHAAGLPAARDPPPRGVERSALRRTLGRSRGANLSERLRRAVDLEHWAAFNPSFERLCDWLRTLARGTEAAAAARDDRAARRRRPQRSSVSEVELGSRTSGCRVLPARLLAVPQPAVAEGTPDRRDHRLSGRRADLRGARTARRRAGTLGVVELLRRATFENSIGELVSRRPRRDRDAAAKPAGR